MDIVEEYPSVEKVDNNILRRFDELVQTADAEALARLLESWAKYIAARRNNDVFGKEETEEERQRRKVADILEAQTK